MSPPRRCARCGDVFESDHALGVVCGRCDYRDDDADDGFDPDDSWEPVGSCEWCGTNLYPDDIGLGEELCDQCLWHAEQNEGGDDCGLQPVT